MKNAIILTSLVILGILLTNCKKNSDQITLSVKLINAQGQEISSFQSGDTTVSFKFFLYNNSDNSITYHAADAPGACFNFLKVYWKNAAGKYEYIGKPILNFGGPAFSSNLEANQVVILCAYPIIPSLRWPDMIQGSYYVGDTVTFGIDQKYPKFYSRIYFSVK